MRSLLNRSGRLIPLTSVAQAHRRRQQLRVEMPRVEAQLADPARREGRTAEAYESWAASARAALDHYKSEDAQLAEWIVKRAIDIENLLHEAYQTLLGVEADVDLTARETAVVDKLKEHYSERRTSGRISGDAA